MDRRRAWTLAAAAAALALAAGGIAAARSTDDRSASKARPAASDSAPVTVIQPGRPGETATVTDSDRVKPGEVSTFNRVDTTFAQMMIVHHEQAIRMAALAPERAASDQLRSLAERMTAAQRVEIDVLRAWLTERRQALTDASHDHATMPGMQSEAAIAELTAATGASFDRRFVTMMSAHHEGARRMAADVLRGGSDLRLGEIANEMAVEQASEIRRMTDLM